MSDVISSSADDMFCKSQLITCNRVKECNGVCPFEEALKHADKTQTMNDQHTVDHDRDWIIGCIEHDGFIHTHRFDKANQIIHDALSADTSSDLISRADAIDACCRGWNNTAEDCIRNIKALPSADAEQGEWIFNAYEKTNKSWFECSVCGSDYFHKHNYCPNCGAMMTPYKGGDDK